MLFYSTVELNNGGIVYGINEFFKLLKGFLKYFKRSISMCHICCVLLLVFGIYITSSYITFQAGGKYSILNASNDTDFQFVSYNVQSTVSVPKIHIPNEVVVVPSSIKIGEIVLNCGLQEPCSDGEFSVHIYTGKDHSDEPRLCIDGKYILSKSVNGGGRGINVVVVDNLTRTVTRVSHFDTYEKESTALETLLLTLRTGDIVILFTFDEPSRKLSRVARLLLYELGSAFIQNLGYRGSWYLVTQKGISGFSPFEELHLVGSNGWPKHHSVRLCIPFQIQDQLIHPDPYPRTNQPRVEFCQRHRDHPMFCDVDVVNDPLIPSPIVKHPSSSNKIYSVPIIVMTGQNAQYLPLTLETLIRQSGVNPSLVVVFYLPHLVEIPEMCELFGFMPEELTQSQSYCEQVNEAFETAHLLFPDAREFLFIGAHSVLAPDFLLYMGQLLPLITRDYTITSVSAFNENGFNGVSEDPTLLYKVETFSTLSMLVRRNFFQRSWCKNVPHDDIFVFTSKIEGICVVPDVSRVLPLSLESTEWSNSSFYSALISNERAINYDENIRLKEIGKLLGNDYDRQISAILGTAASVVFNPVSIQQCAYQNTKRQRSQELPDLVLFIKNNITGKAVAVYFNQVSKDDTITFQLFCDCFGLFSNTLYSPRGVYKGMLRFMLNGRQMFLIGSSSPFHRHKPSHVLTLGANLQSSKARS